MGTDLPMTSPLSGAIVRGIRKVIFIRSRLLDSTGRAICAPVGSLGRRQTECQPDRGRLSATRQVAPPATSLAGFAGARAGRRRRAPRLARGEMRLAHRISDGHAQPSAVRDRHPCTTSRQTCMGLSVLAPNFMCARHIARRPRAGRHATAHSSRRTIGLGALVALAWRRATTVKPARTNIESVPLKRLAEGTRPPSVSVG